MKTVNIFYGENTYLIEAEIRKVKKDFNELINGINYVNISEENVHTLINELQTPAFGYPKKLIIVRDCNLLKKESKTKKNKELEITYKLTEYIEKNIELLDEIILLIIEKDVDKTNKLYKIIQEYGNIQEFPELSMAELIKKLKTICNNYKVNVAEDTLKYIIEICGTSLSELINEIRKLIEYAGTNGTIDKDAVKLLSIPKIESVIFDLTDNLGNKNISGAIEVLNNLIYNKEPVQKILITLYNHFKKLYIVKIAQKENIDIISSLNLKPNQTFLVSKYKKQADYFEEKILRKLLNELYDLDFNSKVRTN